VTADSVQALVEKYYGGIPASPAPILPRTPEPDQTAEARKTLTLNIQNQKILMGYKVPPAAHADAAQRYRTQVDALVGLARNRFAVLDAMEGR
jgi:predicted Zn-dependent peptidase